MPAVAIVFKLQCKRQNKAAQNNHVSAKAALHSILAITLYYILAVTHITSLTRHLSGVTSPR